MIFLDKVANCGDDRLKVNQILILAIAFQSRKHNNQLLQAKLY